MDEDCWDDVAIRDIIAVVLYSLHLRDRQPIGDVSWGAVLWQLASDHRVNALADEVLPAAGHALTRDAVGGAPVTERWRWLTRTWNPDAPIRPRHRAPAPAYRHRLSDSDAEQVEPRWKGMSRSIGAALPDPAVEICTPWAADVVGEAFLAQLGGFPKFARVRVTDGPFMDHRGYVRGTEWAFDDTTQHVDEVAYHVVDLDDVQGTELLSPACLARSHDQRWPRRAKGSLEDGPPPGLHDPLPPMPSCAQDLEAILERASNPQAVPEELRRTIGSGVRHHHLRVDGQALPAPRRVTWMLIRHWYQLTEPYAEDQRGEVWEVEIKLHLHDADPSYHLALTENDARALIAGCTGGSA